ncbi:hypothetical protein [Catenulispora subtropica]
MDSGVAGGDGHWGPHKPGQSFHDEEAGVTITVVTSSSTGDVVTVTKS